MRTALALASLAASAAALPELSLQKHTSPDAHLAAKRARGLDKRAGTLGTDIYEVLTWSEGGAYYLNISVGTPPQYQVVQLDTGSSDLYLDASTASACHETGPHSCQGGTFNPGNSNSYKVVQQSPAFNTSFGDGSTAYGPYSTDVLGINDLLISNVEFGVATTVVSEAGYAIGLMGVGYSVIEAGQGTTYPNVPEVLVNSGVINSRVYSLFLNDNDDVSGSILFGGIDTSKYTGKMAVLDLLPSEYENSFFQLENTGIVDQFISTVTDVSATVNGTSTTIISGGQDGITAYKSSNSALAVLLDSGSTAWSVPESIYNRYFAPVFSFVDQDGLCSCSYINSQDSVTLTFGGKVQITVPAREYIVPVYNTTTREPIYFDAKKTNQVCAFLISAASSTGEGFQIVGDAILKSMYVVYDLDNGQVGVAQAATSSSSPNVVTVSAGPSGIAKAASNVITTGTNSWTIAPAATDTASHAVSTGSTTLGTATGEAAVPTSAQPIGGAAASNGGSSGSSTSPSKGAAAGVAVPGGSRVGSVWIAAFIGLAATAGVGMLL